MHDASSRSSAIQGAKGKTDSYSNVKKVSIISRNVIVANEDSCKRLRSLLPVPDHGSHVVDHALRLLRGEQEIAIHPRFKIVFPAEADSCSMWKTNVHTVCNAQVFRGKSYSNPERQESLLLLAEKVVVVHGPKATKPEKFQ